MWGSLLNVLVHMFYQINAQPDFCFLKCGLYKLSKNWKYMFEVFHEKYIAFDGAESCHILDLGISILIFPSAVSDMIWKAFLRGEGVVVSVVCCISEQSGKWSRFRCTMEMIRQYTAAQACRLVSFRKHHQWIES